MNGGGNGQARGGKLCATKPTEPGNPLINRDVNFCPNVDAKSIPLPNHITVPQSGIGTLFPPAAAC